MSVHIGAPTGAVAPTVLLPGDPLRAQFVAENYLQDVDVYNQVRGMLGFTGTYRGERISVQGSGMGMPSMAIYVNELIQSYGVQRIIRIGSGGSLQPSVLVRDIVFAMTASTDSAMNHIRFKGMDYAPPADWRLLSAATRIAERSALSFHVGGIFSSDTFYQDDREQWRLWADYGLLAVEMETNQLYTLAAKHGIHALAILTISDSLVTGEELTADERQSSFHDMATLALSLAAAPDATSVDAES